MKKMILVLAGFLVIAFASNSFALTVGFVDVEKAIKQYDGTAKLSEKLKKDAAVEEASIEKETNDLKKIKDELERKSSIMDKKELMKQSEEWQQRYEKLKLKTLETQQKFMLRQRELYANLVDEINVIIGKIAKEKKYDYVFDKATLLFGGEDITYLVIKEMNGK